VAERLVVPPKPGNAGGGKGPQFKTDARRSEGPGDWETYQLRTAFRNCRRRCTRKRRQTPAIASTPSTTRSAARYILADAYAQCRSNKGASGVDRQDFSSPRTERCVRFDRRAFEVGKRELLLHHFQEIEVRRLASVWTGPVERHWTSLIGILWELRGAGSGSIPSPPAIAKCFPGVVGDRNRVLQFDEAATWVRERRLD
jgi:hypothetical protein